MNTDKLDKFISVFRVSLVRDENVHFDQTPVCSAPEAQRIIQKLISTLGQPDREQFCVILLNTKNKIIGLNIVSVGDLRHAVVHPREVLKCAILANASSMILCHNHPSEDLIPSVSDKKITEKIIKAADIMSITVHEHLIISMENDDYYSFAEHGLIQENYRDIESRGEKKSHLVNDNQVA
ncbi:MAG: JAB domain-containing protein [Desulfobacteraceae bacterium]|nr:JAB domain-containing protein [Desulfobacteraceae bacterium]